MTIVMVCGRENSYLSLQTLDIIIINLILKQVTKIWLKAISWNKWFSINII